MIQGITFQGFVLIIALINLCIGVFVFLKNPRKLVNAGFFALVLGIVIWSGSIALIFLTHNFFFNQFIFYGTMLTFGSLFFFSYVFPKNTPPPRYVLPLYLPLVAVVAGIPFNLYVQGVSLRPDGGLEPVNGPGMPFFTAAVVFYLLFSCFNFIQTYRRTVGIERLQMKYFIVGVVAFLASFAIFDVILPAFHIFELNFLGPVASFIFSGFAAYAIIRYHLMDIDIIIRGGTIFSLLFFSIAFIFTTLISAIEHRLPTPVSYLLSALIITATFSPLKKFLESITDQYLFQKRYDFQETVSELNHLLVATPNLDILLQQLLERLTAALRIDRAAILLSQTENTFAAGKSINIGIPFSAENRDMIPFMNEFEKLEPKLDERSGAEILIREELGYRMNAEPATPEKKSRYQSVGKALDMIGYSVAAPIFSHDRLVAILLLGPKQSNDPFFKQDIQLLESIIYELGFPIENASIIKRLMHLDTAKSEFISVVSHQLRTPLAVARWNAELLLEIPEITKHAALKSRVDTMYGGIMALGDGLNDLLKALEIIEGKISARSERLPFMNGVLVPVLSELSETFRKKEQTIAGIDMGHEVEIMGDGEKLRHIVRVLLSNASIYSPVKSAISISIEERADTLNFSVEDEGIGVPEENREIIFERFFRGDEAKKISPNGLGVGLFISRAFAEMHGGKLTVRDKNSQRPGASFMLTLPIKKDRI